MKKKSRYKLIRSWEFQVDGEVCRQGRFSHVAFWYEKQRDTKSESLAKRNESTKEVQRANNLSRHVITVCRLSSILRWVSMGIGLWVSFSISAFR